MAGEAIFVGYRRDDTADVAGRIYDAMAQRFGKNRVFKDVDNIGPGVEFGDYIKSILPKCRVALMLIGPQWLDSNDEDGRPRLEDEHDWVRVEIETALATPGLLTVPVLVNGARMPRASEVPESLRPLLRRNAAIIRRDPDFHDDVARLATALRASVSSGILDLSKLGGDHGAPQTPRAARERRGRSMAARVAASGVLAALVASLVIWAPWSTTPAPSMVTETAAKDTMSVETSGPATSTIASPQPPSPATTASQPPASSMPPSRDAQNFRDCPECPEMVPVAGGTFTMGSPSGESRRSNEAQSRVTLSAFAIGRYEVTFAQWDSCAAAGGCTNNRTPSDQGWGRANRPVINISWNDAQEYTHWLSQRTGHRYRLPSEAEWEYAARAGTATPYSWGNQFPVCDPNARNGAHFVMCPHRGTSPVGSYRPNPLGLYDMHGNVAEIVAENCYNLDCAYGIQRGGAWNEADLRSAARYTTQLGWRDDSTGFRVARTP